MRPAPSNSSEAIGTDEWFVMVINRIQRPSMPGPLTALNDYEPPETYIISSVHPWVGRTDPSDW